MQQNPKRKQQQQAADERSPPEPTSPRVLLKHRGHELYVQRRGHELYVQHRGHERYVQRRIRGMGSSMCKIADILQVCTEWCI